MYISLPLEVISYSSGNVPRPYQRINSQPQGEGHRGLLFLFSFSSWAADRCANTRGRTNKKEGPHWRGTVSLSRSSGKFTVPTHLLSLLTLIFTCENYMAWRNFSQLKRANVRNIKWSCSTSCECELFSQFLTGRQIKWSTKGANPQRY